MAKSKSETAPQATITTCHQAMSFLSSDTRSVPTGARGVGRSLADNW